MVKIGKGRKVLRITIYLVYGEIEKIMFMLLVLIQKDFIKQF